MFLQLHFYINDKWDLALTGGQWYDRCWLEFISRFKIEGFHYFGCFVLRRDNCWRLKLRSLRVVCFYKYNGLVLFSDANRVFFWSKARQFDEDPRDCVIIACRSFVFTNTADCFSLPFGVTSVIDLFSFVFSLAFNARVSLQSPSCRYRSHVLRRLSQSRNHTLSDFVWRHQLFTQYHLRTWFLSSFLGSGS